MNNYDEIKNIYDNNFIYNNEFVNYDDDFSFWTYWMKKIKPCSKIFYLFGQRRIKM